MTEILKQRVARARRDGRKVANNLKKHFPPEARVFSKRKGRGLSA